MEREVLYSKTHEWVAIEGETATVGITDYAQREIGSIVYVELPKVGAELRAGREASVLESTKAAADVYAPASGVVTAVNEVVKDDTELINRSPESEGWLFKLRMSDRSELDKLYDRAGYEALGGL